MLTQIQKGENKKLELKEILPSNEKIAKTVIAFTNTAGGKLIIGVDDDKNIVGVDKDLFFNLQNTIAFLQNHLNLGAKVEGLQLKEEPSFISIIFHRKTDGKVSNSAENMPNSAKKVSNSIEKVSNSIELNLYDQKILEYLQNHKQIVSEEVEKLLDIKEAMARRILSNMAKKGLLQKIGKTKGSYYILNSKANR